MAIIGFKGYGLNTEVLDKVISGSIIAMVVWRRLQRVLGVIAFSVFGLQSYADSAAFVIPDTVPEGEVVYRSSEVVRNYRLALGSLRKINGVWLAENELKLQGDVHSETLLIPPGYDADEMIVAHKDVYERQGYELLFTCQGKACGASNRWANHVFKHRELFGSDVGQHYWVAKRVDAGQ